MSDAPSKAGVQGEPGVTLVVVPRYQGVLAGNGLTSFRAFMNYHGGEVMRAVPGRSTVRIALPAGDGSSPVMYLKRYERGYLDLKRKTLRYLGWAGAADEAHQEWEAIHELTRLGFNAAQPVAFGQLRSAGIVSESFLLTAEIVGGVAGHDYTRRLDSKERRVFAMEVADLTRRFFGAGFAHRDYYLSHVFVVESTDKKNERKLYLIDLQRLFRPKCLRRRWMVKDLAALGYTAQLAGASRTDLWSFFKRCFQIHRPEEADRELLRQVTSRIEALHRRGPRYDVIWNQPGVRPPNV